MSYLVLARKWRPRDFESLVGQDHVVRALTHALSTGRLHHAWLFTGTRGVGKTTLSRILAKSLNCETGITATACGQCRACTEIDGGRFVDYVELDAASNRGVEEMTQLLEQAVYAPAVGRFKVYMIDEVHMLSGHAFNAMLKTLEEPPPHVKFILATTDPQKIPPTVLSRCLQFNLKQMPPEAVAEYLQKVLTQEGIPYESKALRLIGQAASGSMRDALSLTDQAIAYSSANLSAEAVRTMLGSVDQTHLTQLLKALLSGDAAGVLAVADALASRGISFRAALADLAVLMSQLAIHQRVPTESDSLDALDDEQRELAKMMPADLLQLFYTVAVHGRQEMSLAPDEYAGFMMVCLKMLSFVDVNASDMQPKPSAEKKTLTYEQIDQADQSPARSSVIKNQSDQSTVPIQASENKTQTKALEDSIPDTQIKLDERFVLNWPHFAVGLPLTGMAQQLATQSACAGASDDALSLVVPTQALTQGAHVKRLSEVLAQTLGRPIQIKLMVGELGEGASSQSIADAQARERQLEAEEIVRDDPFVNALIEGFGAHVVPGSVRAADGSG
ncbi:DNA polymerase III subunit gamma/tau [Orrella daihaiensis]|uniref:DNA polymerase III subunit gamma/tau n=1 Tax=Orrella daihaiensis TaxID=2782176 RepID=A0ABY4AI15_9BURK|nr:DNA polymerase III subunit gamma/tau [Orrella daihaiensis]UOD49932.1 DNA polymerase III subunit gamma/tau [Orrella daihaiensis]